jgi:hypothetical protein
MADIIANDEKHLWRLVQKTEPFAEPERRGSTQHRRLPNVPNRLPDYSERRTATASWQRSILIIAGLSALCWAAVIFLIIAIFSSL